MRTLPLLSLAAALSACSPAKVAGTVGGDDTGTLDIGSDDGTDGSDGSDGSDGVEASTEDYEGDWVGGFALTGTYDGSEYFACEGDLELDADDDGEVSGSGGCDVDWVGRLSGEVDATFDAEGTLSGLMVFSVAGQTVELILDGAAEGDDLQAGLEGELAYGDYRLDLTGDVAAERE